MIETDSGWEDAIWQYGSWSKTLAVVTTSAGAVAAVSEGGSLERSARRPA